MKADHHVDDGQRSGSRVSRRKALQALATGVGASVAAPLAASDAGNHAHVSMAPVEQTAAASTHAFFSDHQFATVQVLSALILPGAEASGTPTFLDRLLAVESADVRRRFVSALGAIDGAVMRAHGRAFKDVTAAEQTAILTEASTMAPATRAPGAEPVNLRDHFDHLKGWIADIHFSSEAGLRELGSTGSMFFERFNGCATQP